MEAEPSPPKLYDQVENAIDRRFTSAMLALLIQEPLAKIALGQSESLAVEHPLGFISLYLEMDGNRSVVLHEWAEKPPAWAPNYIGEIHQHSWELQSVVLWNEIEDQLVVVEFNRDADRSIHGPRRRYPFQVFDAQSKGAVDEMLLTELQAAVVGFYPRRKLGPGDSYSIRKGTFHQSLLSRAAITLVLADNDPGATNYSLGSLASYKAGLPGTFLFLPGRGDPVPRKRYSRAETMAVALRVMKRLGLELPESPEVRQLLRDMPGAKLL